MRDYTTQAVLWYYALLHIRYAQLHYVHVHYTIVMERDNTNMLYCIECNVMLHRQATIAVYTKYIEIQSCIQYTCLTNYTTVV